MILPIVFKDANGKKYYKWKNDNKDSKNIYIYFYNFWQYTNVISIYFLQNITP